MEALLPIIMQLIGGGAGGGIAGKLMGGSGLSSMMGMVTGAVGGVGGTAIAGMIPGLSGLLGKAGDMAGAASDAAGATAATGLDLGALAGNGVTGLVGGGVLTGVVSLVKGAMSK